MVAIKTSPLNENGTLEVEDLKEQLVVGDVFVVSEGVCNCTQSRSTYGEPRLFRFIGWDEEPGYACVVDDDDPKEEHFLIRFDVLADPSSLRGVAEKNVESGGLVSTPEWLSSYNQNQPECTCGDEPTG